MKKIKFNKKTKMLLSALTLTATSATVLAACKPRPTPDSGKNEDKTAEKIDFVNNLLDNKGFQSLLNSIVKEFLEEEKTLGGIKIKIDTLIEESLFDESKLSKSKIALGQKSDLNSNTENSSFFANLKSLEENYESKKTNAPNFSSAKDSVELETKLKAVRTDAEALLNLINKNVLSETEKTKLKAEGENLKAILSDYAKAKTKEVARTKLKEFKKDWENLEKNDIYLKLENLLKAGLKLDHSVNDLSYFIKIKTPKFLKTLDGSSNDANVNTTLEKLSLNLKTKILGKIGTDSRLWSSYNVAPETVTEHTTTGLYSIDVFLKENKWLFSQTNSYIKQMTFNKDLLLKEEAAVNLLATYIDQKLLGATLRLNAYLLNDDSNLEKLLNSLFTNANTVGSGTISYAKFVKKENSDFVKALNAAAEQETNEVKKAKIIAIKTAFLKSDGVSKALDAFYNTNVLTAAAELEPKVSELNKITGLATNYGDTLKILGEFNYLQENVLTPLENINKTVEPKEKNTLTLFDELKTKLEKATPGSLKTVIEAYLSETGYQADVVKNLEPFIKKEGNKYSGYYYALINGTPAKDGVAKQLSLSELKAELEEFKSGENKPLTKGLDLAKKYLESHSGPLPTLHSMEHLCQVYNNGDVLEDHQTPSWLWLWL